MTDTGDRKVEKKCHRFNLLKYFKTLLYSIAALYRLFYSLVTLADRYSRTPHFVDPSKLS